MTEESAKVVVSFDPRREPPGFVVDVMTVAFSDHMFALMFGELSPFRDPRPGQNGEPATVEARPVSSLRMLPDAYEQAMERMVDAWNSWAEKNGHEVYVKQPKHNA